MFAFLLLPMCLTLSCPLFGFIKAVIRSTCLKSHWPITYASSSALLSSFQSPSTEVGCTSFSILRSVSTLPLMGSTLIRAFFFFPFLSGGFETGVSEPSPNRLRFFTFGCFIYLQQLGLWLLARCGFFTVRSSFKGAFVSSRVLSPCFSFSFFTTPDIDETLPQFSRIGPSVFFPCFSLSRGPLSPHS